MKKQMLMAFPKLTATEEMKQIAASDMPRKEKTEYGYVTEVCEYYVYLRCVVQDGILKAALFFPDYLRLDGNNPAYEVYLDKEKRQFITYDCLNQKWSEAKLDRLDWKHWYAKNSWVSEEESAVMQTYLDSDKKGASAILRFQRDVRDEQLVQRHRRETDPWDKDLEQVPELPKDWNRWVDKVAIQQNYIYYHYKKGGAKTGFCTYCEKEVPIKGHPHHNQEGHCSCCRHPVVFKAYGRAGYMQTDKHYAYLIQRCRDGFVIREFLADRTYRKKSLPQSKMYCREIRRTIYDRELKPRSYYWGMYKQRNMRWISCSSCSYSWHDAENGRIYGKTLPHLEKHELRCTGLVQWIRKHKSIDPESYLAVWSRLPQMEQIWKSGLSKLTKECFKNCDGVRKMILYPEAPKLIRALGLDSQGFNRLRQMDGDTEDLGWLQVEKKRGKPITNELLRWFRIHKIRAMDILFIVDRMSPLQIRNYLQKQKKHFEGSCRQALITWQDYMAMAQRLHIDTSDEIIYRARKLRQRHDELVIQCEAGSLELQAEKMAEKYPNVDGICRELQKKYTYSEEEYMVAAPENIFAIIKEGRMLHHCVGNDGSGERYYERMERRESFILFLRRTEEPEDPYYTLEIEPDGTVRQKRTLFDRQHEDIEQATDFLRRWQKVIAERLTGRDLKLAAESRVLREKEFVQLKKDRVIIHTGHLAGRLLADVLMADLMENTESIQAPALAAAA